MNLGIWFLVIYMDFGFECPKYKIFLLEEFFTKNLLFHEMINGLGNLHHNNGTPIVCRKANFIKLTQTCILDVNVQ